LSVSGSSEITLTVINHLAGAINNVQIEPITTLNIAVSPKTAYLGSMTAAMSQDLHFALNPFEIGPASVTFNLSYRNGDNKHHQQLIIPFTVIEVLDVAPVINRFPSKIAKGTSERVSVEVYNAKSAEITGVIVTPITDVPISPSQYFIGSMSPDDVFSASFDIDTTTLEQQDYAIAFKVNFKQDNEYYETPVISQSFTVTAQNVSGQEPTLIIPIGIVLILLLIVLFFYIRRRKRRST
ncbi:MAG: hypothetical protein KKG04_05730, partial [Candidatus Thermoplasmatota archaeon]|nr:hypothetical protein [Candidatus Thermoplasmatota archaeon]